VYAARAVAGTVLAQLDEYAHIVAEEARDPRLAAALTRGDDEGLRMLCEALHARHGGNSSSIGLWFIGDAGGARRTVVPPAVLPGWTNNYAFRDYFRGAMAQAPGAHRPAYVSRAIRATSDGRYKVVITSPIRGEDGTAVGLLGAAISTDRRFGTLKLSDDRRIAILTARRDRDWADEALPDEHILLVHGGVEHGEGIVVESKALRQLTARRDAAGAAGQEQLRLPPPAWVEAEDNYQDPLAERDPHGAKGPWLAGVAPVGHTELAVIVQTRLEDAIALDRGPFRVLAAWLVGGAALLFTGLFAALRTMRPRMPRAMNPTT